MSSELQPLLKGYSEGIGDLQGKERDREKLQLIDGQDHVKKEWKDDVDLWPEVTYVEVGIHPSVKT